MRNVIIILVCIVANMLRVQTVEAQISNFRRWTKSAVTDSDSVARETRNYTKVGTLTAYYAKVAFGDYSRGDLIVDTNDPFNRMVENSSTTWKYEGDAGGEYYSTVIPKSKVRVRKYTMCELPVDEVIDGATFVTKDRKGKLRIFRAELNGHKYKSYSGMAADYSSVYVVDEQETANHENCMVISIHLYTSGKGSREWLFEDPLHEELGNIRLYQNCRFNEDEGIRHKSGKIGYVEEEWYNQDELEEGKSAYSSDGKLLTDQVPADGIPDYISIAYIPSLKAIYVNGVLYYKHRAGASYSNDYNVNSGKSSGHKSTSKDHKGTKMRSALNRIRSNPFKWTR